MRPLNQNEDHSSAVPVASLTSAKATSRGLFTSVKSSTETPPW